jgi:hypothetical protein
LAEYYERAGQWQESYTWATIGHGWATANPDPLPAEIGYAGSYALLFQKGVAAWWIGRKDEALSTLHTLADMDINQMYKDAVAYNLENLNAVL